MSPTADLSVRIAWPEDADAIVGVQERAWRAEYADALPAVLAALVDREALAAAWREELVRPRDARNRVLVALERATVRGYALTLPSPDLDADPVAEGELTDLTIDPDHLRQGHGSRLLQAAADTLRADRFTSARVWVGSTDDIRRSFLTSAGFAPDGAHRELDLDGTGTVLVKQVRLHAAL